MYGGRGKQSQKFSFRPFGPQFGLKIRGLSPGSETGLTDIYSDPNQ